MERKDMYKDADWKRHGSIAGIWGERSIELRIVNKQIPTIDDERNPKMQINKYFKLI